MNISEIQKDDALYKKALELRYRLFFKEHNLPKEVLDDGKENESTHIAMSHENELVTYGRLSALGNGEFQISQMVVAPTYQSQGYGTKLLLKLIQTAQEKGAKSIVLNARTTAIDLYKKQGFRQVGQVYNSDSTGLAHIKMVHDAIT